MAATPRAKAARSHSSDPPPSATCRSAEADAHAGTRWVTATPLKSSRTRRTRGGGGAWFAPELEGDVRRVRRPLAVATVAHHAERGDQLRHDGIVAREERQPLARAGVRGLEAADNLHEQRVHRELGGAAAAGGARVLVAVVAIAHIPVRLRQARRRALAAAAARRAQRVARVRVQHVGHARRPTPPPRAESRGARPRRRRRA